MHRQREKPDRRPDQPEDAEDLPAPYLKTDAVDRGSAANGPAPRTEMGRLVALRGYGDEDGCSAGE
jgi:hypothetical protein